MAGLNATPLTFVLSPNGRVITARSHYNRPRLSSRRARPTHPAHRTTTSAHREPSRTLPWPRVALVTVGTALGAVFGNAAVPQRAAFSHFSRPTHAATVSSTSTSHHGQRLQVKSRKSSHVTLAANVISLDDFNIKREDFLSDRELRRAKTTQFSEAEQEIMELEEWEVETQWFKNLQMLWAGFASIAGMFVLYKGGVMWEKWIKEQERKDMEEEIELTGTFIDPRAVRKDEDGDNGGSSGQPSSGGSSDGGPSSDPPSAGTDDISQGDVESLEKLFGKS